MPYDTADREAHVAMYRRRLRVALDQGAGPERITVITGQLLTAERLLRRALRS
jgi:hypothetical protein